MAFAQEDNVLAAPPPPHRVSGVYEQQSSPARRSLHELWISACEVAARLQWDAFWDSGWRFGLHLQPPPHHRIDKLSLVNRGDGLILTEFKLFPRSNFLPPAPLQTNKWDLGESNKSDCFHCAFFIFKRSPHPLLLFSPSSLVEGNPSPRGRRRMGEGRQFKACVRTCESLRGERMM